MGSQLDTTMQIRLPPELKSRIARIAERTHLSESDVVRLCLSQAIPIMELHGLTVVPTPVVSDK